MDANGDGLVDLVQSRGEAGTLIEHTYLNNGNGTGWTTDAVYDLPIYGFVDDGAYDGGIRLDDVNGDGLADMILSRDNNNGGTRRHAYIKNNDQADLLSAITYSKGATTTIIIYKGTPEFLDGSNKLLNQKLPLNLHVVDAIAVNDGFGTIGTTTYTYGGGSYFYHNPADRMFAQFATTTKTDPLGFVTKTYYHQGNATNTPQGEFEDDIAKRGKPYPSKFTTPQTTSTQNH